MKLIVSGASEPLGLAIIPGLLQAGAEIVLTDGDSGRMRELFPSATVDDGLEEIAHARGFDAVLQFDRCPGSPVTAPRLSEQSADGRAPVLINFRPAELLLSGNPQSVGRACAEDDRLGTSAAAQATNVYVPRRVDRTGGAGILGGVLRSIGRAVHPSVDPRAVVRFLEAREWLRRDEFILSRGQDGNGLYSAAARFTDVAFALAILIGFWWLLLAIMAAVRLDSGGAAIFAQTRVGRRGRLFTCYKFRTMRTGTPHVATHEVAVRSVTRIGKFLRASKLDELPQVWNLLRGELSLVGPRPCLPGQTALVQARTEAGVLEIKPGITGLAQIHGVDMSDPEWLAIYDARYVGLQSIAVDWRIMLATALGKGNKDRVRA